MRTSLMIIFVILFIAGSIYLFSNFLEGVDNKITGISKNSMSIKESKANDVFQIEVTPSKHEILLPNGKKMKIKNAWIENAWSYDYVFPKVKVKKENYEQLIVEEQNYSYNDDRSYLIGDSFHHYFGIRYSEKDSSGTISIQINEYNKNLKFYFYAAKDSICDTLEFYKVDTTATKIIK